MKKSVKIVINGQFNNKTFPSFLLEKSKNVSVEGLLQILNLKSAIMYLTGNVDDVESFIDLMFDENSGIDNASIDIKAMDEEKDFRGIFRVVHNADLKNPR